MSSNQVSRSATCQKCGGEILLEVDFGEPHTQAARIYAECDGCGNSAWLSWEEIPSRALSDRSECDLMLHIPSGATDLELWDREEQEAENLFSTYETESTSIDLGRELRKKGYKIVEVDE